MVRTTEKPSKPKLKDQNNPATGQADGNGTSPVTHEAEDSTARRPELSPEASAKLAEIRGRIETSVGQVVLMMMQVPRYRHHTLSDLNIAVNEEAASAVLLNFRNVAGDRRVHLHPLVSRTVDPRLLKQLQHS